jgi:hypothetical protein
MKEGWNHKNIDSNQKAECPSLASKIIDTFLEKIQSTFKYIFRYDLKSLI